MGGAEQSFANTSDKKQEVSIVNHTKDSDIIKHVIQLSMNYLSKNKDTYGII